MAWVIDYPIVVAYLYGFMALLGAAGFAIACVWEHFRPFEPSIPSREVADLMVRGSESTDRRRRAA